MEILYGGKMYGIFVWGKNVWNFCMGKKCMEILYGGRMYGIFVSGKKCMEICMGKMYCNFIGDILCMDFLRV